MGSLLTMCRQYTYYNNKLLTVYKQCIYSVLMVYLEYMDRNVCVLTVY